jgi:hypothetical protein
MEEDRRFNERLKNKSSFFQNYKNRFEGVISISKHKAMTVQEFAL